SACDAARGARAIEGPAATSLGSDDWVIVTHPLSSSDLPVSLLCAGRRVAGTRVHTPAPAIAWVIPPGRLPEAALPRPWTGWWRSAPCPHPPTRRGPGR